MKKLIAPALIAFSALPQFALGEERTLTPEQMEAIANAGVLGEGQQQRPAKLPDLTKGEMLPEEKYGHLVWTLGPTGIRAIMSGRYQGDQVQVQGTLKGSPSEGKFLPGDVIIGLNGKKFAAGGHLGRVIGNAIIEAEREENGGKLSFLVWRDKNYVKRFGKKDVVSVDIDKLFDKARDDNSLYEWKPEEEREKEALGFGEFPIDPVNLEIDITLRTLPDYSDTAPYDCPKTKQILEEAWSVLEKKFIDDPNDRRSGRGGIIEAIALVASGKPEHRELVKKWVRSPNGRQWHPPKEPIGAMFQPGKSRGMQSWRHGYTGLYCAIYYDATGDDFVLPALEKYAVDTALGQSGGGSWGHTFAFPTFNGGEFHKMNPGYGAINAAGNRCFFLITLAQKLGIDHPEIAPAVKRAHRFFGSYVDQGCIPYGDHPAYASDDSNGKNTGVAFSMKLLGDDYGAKYFAGLSSHCAFSRRGGHGHDYHGNWSSWAATLCGPEVRILNERNLRWRRTLCRMFDGRFVYHSPTWRYGTLRDPTATEVLHQSVIFKQTLITGKDPNEKLFIKGNEMDQLLSSARGMLKDEMLLERAGIPWAERKTADLYKLLNSFIPKARINVAKELGKRYLAGEKEILDELEARLSHEDARMRAGAILGLQACGSDVVLSKLSLLSKLIEDPKDLVRITAVKVISKVTSTDDTQLAMLNATVAEPDLVAPNSVRNATQIALFAKASKLGDKPFESGFDQELVRQAIEDALTLDPVGGRGFVTSRIGVWDKETISRIAGPLTFAAEEEQIVEQMFANRCEPAQKMLRHFGYREAEEGAAHRLRKKVTIARDIRPLVGYKRNLVDPDAVNANPGAFHDFLPMIGTTMIANPLQTVVKVEGTKKIPIPLDKIYQQIAKSKKVTLPSIENDATRVFLDELKQLDGSGAKVKACRKVLKESSAKDYYRKLAAIQFLVDFLAIDSLEDLLPYLGHDYWRLRERSQKLAAELIRAEGVDSLTALLAQGKPAKTTAGILEALSLAGSAEGYAIANEALSSNEPVVRHAAQRALVSLGGTKGVSAVLAHLAKAEDREDLLGAEIALLSACTEPSVTARIRDTVISLVSSAGEKKRKHLYYIISRIGDEKALDSLRKFAETDSIPELDSIVFALSFSPGRAADDLMLELARRDRQSAEVVGRHAARRLVIGPKGYNDLSDKEKLDFAEPLLKLSLSKSVISFLGKIHEARSLRALMYCLEKGVRRAADSLVTCAEGMGKLSSADSKIAAKAVRDVMEYIEVTQLRGGIDGKDFREYPRWKALQIRAGKALLKIHKPEAAPIPSFDPLDLE